LFLNSGAKVTKIFGSIVLCLQYVIVLNHYSIDYLHPDLYGKQQVVRLTCVAEPGAWAKGMTVGLCNCLQNSIYGFVPLNINSAKQSFWFAIIYF
jgi:hypothetical protein